MPRKRQPWVRPARFSYEEGHSTGDHAHDEHQLVYSGHGVLSVETEGSRWVLPTQRAAWVPAGVTHTVFAESTTTMAALYIEDLGPPARDGVAVFAVSALLRQLVLHLVADDTAGPERRRVEQVTIDQIAAAPSEPLRLQRLVDPRLRIVEEALRRDPRDDRTLRAFGDIAGASERTLQRLFVAETGTTFGRWRTRLRLQHGLIWLGRGESVTTAATRSGYDQPSAFIAAFRATFGTTPGRFVRDAAGTA
ncbi:MAG: helix-turn-helix transcriptional regulator [Actinomycetota bacterium]